MPVATSFVQRQILAGYLRAHLVGASGGIRLAEILAADPWTDDALDALPAELNDEISFVQGWASELSGVPEVWVRPTFAVTALARNAISPLRPVRGTFSRAMALEAMRSLVLAKKAMWELGLALNPSPTLAAFDAQAQRQADDLKQLHRRAVHDAFQGQ